MTISLKTQVVILAIILAGILGLFAVNKNSDPDSIARKIVADCARVQGDHAACYETEVPQLYPKLSVPQIFNIVRDIRQNDPSYQFCHVLGHKIGERVVAEDPSKWLDAIPLNPSDGMCSNGFIHGVIGGRFRADVLDSTTTDSLIPDFSKACAPRSNWQPSDLDRAICYHGMGHLFDFITNANLPKALDLCSKVTPSEFSRVCVEGVFMQIYQPLEPDDYQLIAQMPDKPGTTTVRSFCNAFGSPEYVGACLRESWPFFRDGIFDGTGIKAFCSGQPNQTETDACYTSATTIIGRILLGQSDRVVTACEQLPTDRQVGCFTVSAQAILEENRNNAHDAIALCERAPGSLAAECEANLSNRAQFIFGNNLNEYNAFCSSLPMSLRATCLPQN